MGFIMRIPDSVRAQAALAAAMCVLAAGCSDRDAAGQGAGAGGSRPATSVEVVTLAPRPVERTTEFIGTVRSRRSTTIQPQAEGFLTRIAVRSGDDVRPGALLMTIDAEPQKATVASLESQRAAREADLGFVRQQAARMKTLLAAGAASQQEYDQAVSALEAAQAQARALDQQIRQQRVELAYYQITAPTAGTVGDVPVRVGDRVTRSTVLTTIDQNAGLEVYVNVPVQQAPQLAPGLPIRLVDDRGTVLATLPVAFISPSVDDATQTVLVKANLGERARGFRADQFVRAQIVWSTAPGLTVPIVAVNRINGQYFAFVAEPAEGGGAVARQRAVTVGPIVGNDYAVLGGLEAGDRLIVSGIQKIGDGQPVSVTPAAAATQGRS